MRMPISFVEAEVIRLLWNSQFGESCSNLETELLDAKFKLHD